MSYRAGRMGGLSGVIIASAMTLLLPTGCKPPAATPPPATGGLEQAASMQPAASSTATSVSRPISTAPQVDDLPDDPVELSRLANEVHREMVRLIASVQDLASAKAVAGTFPAVDARHRRIEKKLGSRLLSAEMKQQLERDFKAERDRLLGEYSKEYVRVAFIPGAWEHMHPELTPLADMTVIEQDAAGLEREATRLLSESLAILRQVTDVNKALALSPKYRVATCRLGPILSRLHVALGGGVNERQPPQVRELRRQRDEELRRLMSIHGAGDALAHGERPATTASIPRIAANPQQSETDQVVAALRSQDRTQIINTLNQLRETLPEVGHEPIGAEVIRLFNFEPVAGSALEAIKRGWFSPRQIPELKASIPKFKATNRHYILYDGISRTPNLDRQNIDFLASLFDENPGIAVSVLRNVGPAAQESIFPYGTSTKVEVRQCVCEALKDIGLEASLPTLEKLSQDSHPGVSSKAKEAIREIGRPVSERTHLRQRQ
ncbi:MAG TPA: hypothetical protein VMP01_21820 [Pirellulaceae bacterium]|nr:hypothetical protein [Pirellulaceae bacterium]